MTDDSSDFRKQLDAAATDTDALLDALLSERCEAGELQRPARLIEAMRYAALGGGKRVRPFLVLETAALFGVPRAQALQAGAALECVHCYSLVHDDLPAMDDDDLRRGKPTAHKAFDEATAILAGDALLTFAFDVLARETLHPDAAVRVALIAALARAAGLGGMAGGQMLDLAAEGRFGGRRTLGLAEVATLQAMKTGALIEFACRAGAILGRADAVQTDALVRYGRAVGQAFQIADDLIDVESDSATAGKATGKDATAGKATFLVVLGRDAAVAKLAALVDEAARALDTLARDTSVLRAAARFIAARRK